MEFNPASENEKAGLLIFQSEKHYYFLCKSIKNNQPVVELYRSAAKDGEKEDLLASALLDKSQPLLLKIEANNDKYSFYYSEAKDEWTLLKDNVDGKFLSTKVAGGFVGSMFALYATSNGVQTRNVVLFDWFEYKGDDEVFKGRK